MVPILLRYRPAMMALMVLTLVLPLVASGQELMCNDFVDNDGDGLTDLDDQDCQETAACIGHVNPVACVATICSDGIDNDGNGLVDRLDAACHEQLCQDGIDNDGDGLIDGADPDCKCLTDVTGIAGGCTANDVSFVLIGLGDVNDGCFNSSDTVEIRLGASLRSTATTRYDIGMWVALDGGNARTGLCSRQSLNRPIQPQGTPPSAAGLTNGEGPWRNEDGDRCAEIRSGDVDAIYDYPFVTSLPCGSSTNGFVNVGTCASWDNNANTACRNFAEAVPGTSSKCRCEITPSNIPAPQLTASCLSCDRTTLAPGEETTCQVQYTNAAPVCTTPAGTPEHEACGTSAYVRFEVDYPENLGSITALSTSRANDGAAVETAGNDRIVWVPGSSTAPENGIVPPGQSATLSFTFRNEQTSSEPITTNLPVRAFFSPTDPFSATAVEQSANVIGCSFSLTTTPITLATTRGRRGAAGGAAIEWTTATETANAGFHVWLRDGGEWRRATDEPVASQAVSSTGPTSYRLDLGSAEADAYMIEDVAVDGTTTRHGPFAFGPTHGVAPEVDEIDWAAIRSEQARGVERRQMRRTTAAARHTGAGGPGPSALGLGVDRDGIHRVTFEALAAAGFDWSSVNARDVALFRGDRSVPARVVTPAGNGKLGPGAFVEFWGEAVDTLYTGTAVYRLALDAKAARRVAEDTRAPTPVTATTVYAETRTVEPNSVYALYSTTGDPWVAGVLQAFSSPRRTSWTLPVDALAAGVGGEVLHVHVGGVSEYPADPDHHLRVLLNGVMVADERFDGAVERRLSVPLPPGLLAEGANELVLEVAGDTGTPTDLMVLDSYGATYPRRAVASEGALQLDGVAVGGAVQVEGLPAPGVAYRLDAGGPVLLAGTRFEPDGGAWRAVLPATAGGRFAVAAGDGLLIPTMTPLPAAPDLLAGEARYLVLTHADFAGELGPLLGARQAGGYSTAVVDVADVYAAYSDGVVDPEALRLYVADAARDRNTEMVLVVGGDTYDYRGYGDTGSISFVPSLYAATSSFARFTPADPLLGDVDGDGAPDLPVGRLPVRTAGELAAAIDKILAYGSKDYGGTAVFAADRYDANGQISFAHDADRTIDALGDGWRVDRAYLDASGLSAARATLLGGLDDGVALATWVGHSSPTAWSFSGLFRAADAAALDNPGRPAVVVQWGCYNTYYVEPRFNTLGHKLLLSGDRGAAAVLGGSTLVAHSSAQALSGFLTPRLVTPGTTIGEALIAAKRELAVREPSRRDVIVGWTILGDPALVVTP